MSGFAPGARAYFGSPGNEVIVRKSKVSGLGSPYGYLEYVPAGYSDAAGAAKVPVILFLHGIGEMGDGENNEDLNKFLQTGLAAKLHAGFDLPAIVVSPQCPSGDDWWQPSKLNQFMDYVFKTYKNADPDRFYVTGLSMGGGGTWDYATLYPDRPAAIVPICGYNKYPEWTNRSPIYKSGRGVWAFHAYDDTVVGKSNTINNINSMTPTSTSIMSLYPGTASGTATALYWKAGNEAGKADDTHNWTAGQLIGDMTHNAPVRFTMYPSGGHNIWGTAYDNKKMWEWLFTWSKSGRTIASTSPSPSPTATPVVDPVLFSSGSLTIDFGDSSNGTTVANRVDQSRVQGGQLGALKNQSQAVTTASISVVQGFNSINYNGTTTPASSVGVDGAASGDSFYGNDVLFGDRVAPASLLSLGGLDPSKQYELRFFASRMGSNGENRETQYQATGANSGIAYVNAAENTGQLAVIPAIRPASNGTIQIEVKKGPRNNNANGFYYLNSMVVLAQNPVMPSPSPPPPPQEVRVDFGATDLALPTGWNDGRGLLKSGSIGLSTASGASSGYLLATVTAFNNVNRDGTRAPSSTLGIPVAASQDSFYGNDVEWAGATAPLAVMELRGLDPARSYRLEFFASRMASDGYNRETVYKMIGSSTVSGSLDATNNSSRIASGSVRPSASGVIRIEMRKGAANTSPNGFFYLGSLKLKY